MKTNIHKFKNFRKVHTRAFDLSNQALTSYLCKPVVEYKQVSKLIPKYCKLVYIECNSKELCKIYELTLPQESAPRILFEKN
jgi:hypothetical protein